MEGRRIGKSGAPRTLFKESAREPNVCEVHAGGGVSNADGGNLRGRCFCGVD